MDYGLNWRSILWWVVAGVCFATAPIFTNNTSLKGNTCAFIIAIVTAMIILPTCSRGDFQNISASRWGCLTVAGILSGIGVWFFNDIITRTPKNVLWIGVIIMLCSQVKVMAIYNSTLEIMDKGWRYGVSGLRTAGFAFIVIGIYLLLKSTDPAPD